MALTYTQISALAANTIYLNQVQAAILKYALARINVPVTGAELSFCGAVVRSPTSYATRFLTDALILNAAGLASTGANASASPPALDTPPNDAAIDTAISTQWQAQVSAGA